MASGVRQALAILAASVALGLGGNALREVPLPYAGSLDPPPEPEPGADLAAEDAATAVQRWEEGVFFLDIRDPFDWEEERVAGSFSVAADAFDDRYFEVIAGFGPDMPLFVYGAGPDSHVVRRTVAKLQELGHADVGFVTGGLGVLLREGIAPSSGPEEGMP